MEGQSDGIEGYEEKPYSTGEWSKGVYMQCYTFVGKKAKTEEIAKEAQDRLEAIIIKC